MRLAEKVACVTGAGGPMGAAVAARFAREGARLVMTDISGNRLGQSVEAITAAGTDAGRLVAHRADVTKREEAAAVVERGLAAFGRVDILVNIVGGIRDKVMFQPFLGLSEERWDQTFALNLKGNFHLIQMLAPGMRERRYGKIVNVSSINFAGESGNSDYGAAKAAVASLTRTLAYELAPDINVNCIAPGTIRTSVVGRMDEAEQTYYREKSVLKRLGEPADIANAALFLASDEASYITGEILCVSGGIWPAL